MARDALSRRRRLPPRTPVLDAEADSPPCPREQDGSGVFFWICVAWVGLNILLAIFANLLPLPNPNFQNFNAVNAGPEPGPSASAPTTSAATS